MSGKHFAPSSNSKTFLHLTLQAGLQHMACAVGIGEDSLEEVLFLYKLAAGACAKSYGVNVARLAGKIYLKLVVDFTSCIRIDCGLTFAGNLIRSSSLTSSGMPESVLRRATEKAEELEIRWRKMMSQNTQQELKEPVPLESDDDNTSSVTENEIEKQVVGLVEKIPDDLREVDHSLLLLLWQEAKRIVGGADDCRK